MSAGEQRKLAAIMFTDMVGYSALSQRDDKLALELLEEHRQLLREIFPRFNGTEIKTIGDAFLIEFSSALEAAQCAIEIQRTLAKRNHDVTAERRIELRIGIHIGDVVHRAGDVYGDGVNIASRIQALSGAGGICVSMDVERQIRNALETRFEKLAPTELKNISVPMDVFRIVLPWEKDARLKQEPEKGEVRKRRAIPLGWLAVSIVLLLALIGGWFLFGRYAAQRPALPRQSEAATGSAILDKSIAVLPFVDMSQAKDQEYFCDGISEEILDTLAKVEGLRVVARTSSFSFKGRSADVTEVATKLSVATVLEGSLRRDGNRIRVSAQLIARDGFHLWSETYDRELQDVFAMQDEITRAIVDALKIRLKLVPTASAAHDTEAHDFYLRGLYFANKSDEKSLRTALACFQHALDKEPTSARAWIGIAATWVWLADAYVKPLEAYPAVKAAALKAISLDERSADAHCYLGLAIMVLDWNFAGNDAELRRALEIEPNSSLAHFFRGLMRTSQGDYEEAIAHLRNAEKSDPLSPAISNALCIAYLRKGLIDEAIATARRSQQVDPNYIYHDPVMGLVYRQTGQYDQALGVYLKAEELTHSPSAGLAITYARMGRKEDSRRVLNHLLEKARTGYVEGNKIASIYVALGENDEAFRCLEQAYVDHSGGVYDIAFDPDFAAIRSDPRCADLLHRINFQPAQMLAR